VESVVVVVALSVLAFAATNLDNLIVLVGVVSRPGQPFAAVVRGALLSVGLMLALCVAAAFAADLAPKRWIGMLGLVPIALGVRELLALARRSPDAPLAAGATSAIPPLGVASLMLANSADSLGALVPLFAETRAALLPAIVVAVLAVSLGGCSLARWVASHPRVGPLLQRLGPRLVPFVLIAVGSYVLLDTRTDTLGP